MNEGLSPAPALRRCLRNPVPELAAAARDLSAAVIAHLKREFDFAESLIINTNLPAIREWTESLWGPNSAYVHIRRLRDLPPLVAPDQREPVRMPTSAEQLALLERDGYHCRFCAIPVIRKEIRIRIHKAYPNARVWGKTNPEQHAALQAMWAQFDHVLPHSRGGTNAMDNLVVTCAPCNYAKMSYTVEELGLFDPRGRAPVISDWDGLERFR